MTNDIIKIELKDWSHHCADGCCYTWGVTCKITNKDVNQIDTIHFTNSCDLGNGLEVILKLLGHKVDIKINEDE